MSPPASSASVAPARPATVGDLAADGLGVFCWCHRCSHSAVLDAQMLVAQLGPHHPVPALAARLRCTNCGSRDVAARPAWPSLGLVARHG